MSGHSKWAQIKHAKAIVDKKRGLIFSKLAKKIAVAVKEGGGGNPDTNYKLKSAIELARDQGLPNDNIERAIKAASGEGSTAIMEIVYEGYGPFGTAFLVETATDNPNRTASNIKHLFTKHGGNLGAKGSVAWQFETRGQILLARSENNLSELELAAIEAGAEDVKESAEGLEIYTLPLDLQKIKDALVKNGAEVINAELVKVSSQKVNLETAQQGQVQQLLKELSEDEDVIDVNTNANL